jgi:hypothetical protein
MFNMQMTRILYLILTSVVLTLNGAALWALSPSAQGVSAIVPAALIVNAIAWPVALAITYRIGQLTGVEYLRRVRARRAAKKASCDKRHVDA